MKRLLFIANLIWVAGIAYFGVQALYSLAALPLTHSAPPAVFERKAEPTAETEAGPQSFYRVIVDRNLFGTRRQAAPGNNRIDLEDLARTGLKLTLRGTVSGDVAPAYAVIEDELEKRQRLYREGDQVQGADIRMILREQVVLRVNGRDEILAMAKPDDTTDAAATDEEAPVRDDPSREIRLKSDEISAAMGDLHNLARQATIRPNFREGMRDGFLLARVQPRSVFSQIGLKTGDVIKTVNGEELTSVGQALNLYRNLTPGSRVEVLISRQGSDQTLVFAIE
jgi:general secretion pathway protein C